MIEQNDKMKYFYTFVLAALCFDVFGQTSADVLSPCILEAAAKTLGKDETSTTKNSLSKAIILFQETFANGFDGINGNGAWTVNDNGGDSLWVWVQPGGQGLYANGDATGVTHPRRIQHQHWNPPVHHRRRRVHDF